VTLKLLADGVENPANRERIADAAGLLGGACVEAADGRLIAVENAPGARPVYGRRALRDTATLALGNERRGVSRATLAAAAETVAIPTASRTVTTLNVAAAAAVAGWYVLRGSGPQARAAHPDRRRPTVLLCGDDHVEVGSSLRSAAAFGLREVLLEDRGAGWFDGNHSHRPEARAAARRHKNPLRIRRASLDIAAARFDEIVAVTPWGPGPPLARERLTRGRAQLVVIGADAERVTALVDANTRVVTLGLERVAHAPLRLVASIVLAEIARQAGRPTAQAPPSRPRGPRYERHLELAVEGDVILLPPEDLLAY